MTNESLSHSSEGSEHPPVSTEAIEQAAEDTRKRMDTLFAEPKTTIQWLNQQFSDRLIDLLEAKQGEAVEVRRWRRVLNEHMWPELKLRVKKPLKQLFKTLREKRAQDSITLEEVQDLKKEYAIIWEQFEALMIGSPESIANAVGPEAGPVLSDLRHDLRNVLSNFSLAIDLFQAAATKENASIADARLFMKSLGDPDVKSKVAWREYIENAWPKKAKFVTDFDAQVLTANTPVSIGKLAKTINSEVARVKERLEKSTGKKQPSYSTQLVGYEDAPDIGITHSVLIASTVAELVKNAMRAMTKHKLKGRVETIIMPEKSPDQGDLLIHVYDEGPGCDPSEIESFFEEGVTHSRELQGSGLGLTAARANMKKFLQGTVEGINIRDIEDEEEAEGDEKGMRFTIRIPRSAFVDLSQSERSSENTSE